MSLEGTEEILRKYGVMYVPRWGIGCNYRELGILD